MSFTVYDGLSQGQWCKQEYYEGWCSAVHSG